MKIDLSPSLDKFVTEKIQSGDYVDVGEVIRDSLRRWKEREIQEGIGSANLPATKTFWTDLHAELRQEHASGTRA